MKELSGSNAFLILKTVCTATGGVTGGKDHLSFKTRTLETPNPQPPTPNPHTPHPGSACAKHRPAMPAHLLPFCSFHSKTNQWRRAPPAW